MSQAVRKTKKTTSLLRRSLLAKVHIAKKQLCMDDDTYRGMLESRYGKRSASKITDYDLADLVEYLKSQGVKFIKKKGPARAGSKPKADHAEAKKMRALWISLYHLGVVQDPSEKALTSYAKRLSGGKEKGKEALHWIIGRDAYKVIEALKSWAVRDADVCWDSFTTQNGTSENPRIRVISAQMTFIAIRNKKGQWSVIKEGVDWREYHAATVGMAAITLDTPVDELDQFIERLGPIVRRARNSQDGTKERRLKNILEEVK